MVPVFQPEMFALWPLQPFFGDQICQERANVLVSFSYYAKVKKQLGINLENENDSLFEADMEHSFLNTIE